MQLERDNTGSFICFSVVEPYCLLTDTQLPSPLRLLLLLFHDPLSPLDEHYFATLLAVLGREAETECSGWGVAAQDWSKGGAHPKSFT